MVAAAAGATYVASYLGKLDDAGIDGIAAVTAMQEILEATGSTCKILLASVRSVPAIASTPRREMATPVAEAFFDVQAAVRDRSQDTPNWGRSIVESSLGRRHLAQYRCTCPQ
jgi:transaldolase